VLEQRKDPTYYDGFNEMLFREVPPQARRIVEVGCARGRLGMELKKQDPDRYVIGVEYDPESASVAKTRLDEVHVCDLQLDFPDIEAGSVDCVIFGDVLEHLLDPEAVLRRSRELLTDDGIILVCVPNFTHYSIVKALLRADPMYQPSGLLDSTHIRFFSHATFIKMLLDVGLLPNLVHVIASGGTDHMIPAATPLLEYFGVDPGRALKYLDAYQYIFTGSKLPDVEQPAAVPGLTFVACVNDEDQLSSNLLRSPCVQADSQHELLTYRGVSSAAEGLKRGLADAANEIVILVQQDMYLPRGWDWRFVGQWNQAEQQYGPLGVAGLFGLRFRDREHEHVGRIVDRDVLLDRGVALPADVDVMDEVLLAMRADAGLHANVDLGFHLYGADLCLSATEKSLTNVVLDAPAYHNSLFAQVGPSFYQAAERLLAHWPDVRPIYTNMGQLDALAAPSEEPASGSGSTADELVELRRRLAEAEATIAEMTGTRAWRLREALNRRLGRR
jgi:SAM-dependent methyltransferase